MGIRSWLQQPSYGLHEAWTTVDGSAVRSLSEGTLSEAPEIVLLPGLGAPGYLAPLVRRLAGWTRATVLDLPGWNVLPARSSPSTVQGVGARAARWLEVSDSRNVVLLGHSSGAQSALHTVGLVRDRLCGLVLAGPTLDPRARNLATLLLRLLRTLSGERLAEVAAVLPAYWRSGGFLWWRLVHSSVTDRPEDSPGPLLPTLVVTGERDRLASPAWARQLAEALPARCLILPGAHNTCFTFPETTDAVIHEAVLGWWR
jgi:pimeloyl-ACP methyl ester carboxylesterase